MSLTDEIFAKLHPNNFKDPSKVAKGLAISQAAGLSSDVAARFNLPQDIESVGPIRSKAVESTPRQTFVGAGSYHIYTRKESSLPDYSEAPVDPQRKTEGFCHYTEDFGRRAWTWTDANTRLRGYYNFHTGPERGWADIGYHFVVFQGWWNRPIYIFEGRPWNRIPAAQGGHNSGTIAVAVVAAPGETFMLSTADAVAWIFKRGLYLNKIGGHRDVTSTSCPGTNIYRRVPYVADKAGAVTYYARSHYNV